MLPDVEEDYYNERTDEEDYALPHTAEAIKTRLQEWRNRMQEKQNDSIITVSLVHSNVPQSRFARAISQCFDPYLSIYIQQLVSLSLVSLYLFF